MAFTRIFFDETPGAPATRTPAPYGPFGFGTRPFYFGDDLILARVGDNFLVARVVGSSPLFADTEETLTSKTDSGFRVFDAANQGDRITRRSGFIVTE